MMVTKDAFPRVAKIVPNSLIVNSIGDTVSIARRLGYGFVTTCA